MKTATIVRRGFAGSERGVDIYMHGVRRRVDPQGEILRATGQWLSRDRCISSTGQGLKDEGFNVDIKDFRTGRSGATRYTLQSISIGVPVYRLFGRAFARYQWDQLVIGLYTHVQPTSRHAVLEATADYYWSRPFLCGPIRLMLP
jgi:hypothetical protein